MNRGLRSLVILMLVATDLKAEENSATENEAFEFFSQEAKVMTASRRFESIHEAPANVVVYTQDQIRELGVENLSQLLGLISGVQITTHRKGSEKIWMRGITSAYNDKTVLLIDGVPLKELVYSQHPIDEQLSLVDVKRVEIVKGPVSSMYGANALGGVINIITFDPSDYPRQQASVSMGSWNSNRFQFMSSGGSSNASFVFSGEQFESLGDFHERDENGGFTTKRDPQKLEQINARLRAGDFLFTLRHGRYQTDYFSYGDLKDLQWDNQTTLTQALWSRRVNEEVSLEARMYWSLFGWPREKWTYNNSSLSLKKIELTQEKTRSEGGSLQTEWTGVERHIFTAGLDVDFEEALEISEYEYRTNAANPLPTLVRWSDPEKPKSTNLAIRMEDSWRAMPWMRLVAGLRQDWHSQYGPQTSPRAAAIFNVDPRYDIKFFYGSAFRAPSFRELYVQESPAEDNGNPDLKPEHIRSYETDFNVRVNDELTLRLASFYNSVGNFIDPDETTAQYANKGTCKIQGIEPELIIRYGWSQYLFFNSTFLDSQDEQDERISELAHIMANAGWRVDFLKWLTSVVTWNFVGRRQQPQGYQGDIPEDKRRDLLGSYQILNAALTTHGLSVDWRLAINNVFDRQVFNPSYSRDEFDIEHPGRHVMVEARKEF